MRKQNNKKKKRKNIQKKRIIKKSMIIIIAIKNMKRQDVSVHEKHDRNSDFKIFFFDLKINHSDLKLHTKTGFSRNMSLYKFGAF